MTNNDQPMKSYVNMDSVKIVCPCGLSEIGEGDVIVDFVQLHKNHTNGMCHEEHTADGARAYGGQTPPARMFSLSAFKK